MQLLNHSNLHKIILLPFFCFCFKSFSQCTVQTGPPPPNSDFNTGSGVGGETDRKWKVAKDSITGAYEGADIMSGLPMIYYNSSKWISFSASGEHSGDRYFFYKTEFDLPCFSLCGKSYDDDNTFCLNLDLYADNSIYEIYVNGAPQSGNLGNIIPLLPDPFNPIGHTQSDPLSVSLCKNWKSGKNSLIIEIASSATVAGMLAEASINPQPPPDSDTIPENICKGEIFHFGDQNLIESGYYFHSFPRTGKCDSNVVIHLDVKPKPDTTINQSVCEGENYGGYTRSGTYVDTYLAADGCDSTRTLHLTVQEKPKPDLGNKAAICEGDSLLLSPGSFSSYAWQDGSTGEYYAVKKPGLYSVTVTNFCGVARMRLWLPAEYAIYFSPLHLHRIKTGKMITSKF